MMNRRSFLQRCALALAALSAPTNLLKATSEGHERLEVSECYTEFANYLQGRLSRKLASVGYIKEACRVSPGAPLESGEAMRMSSPVWIPEHRDSIIAAIECFERHFLAFASVDARQALVDISRTRRVANAIYDPQPLRSNDGFKFIEPERLMETSVGFCTRINEEWSTARNQLQIETDGTPLALHFNLRCIVKHIDRRYMRLYCQYVRSWTPTREGRCYTQLVNRILPNPNS